VESVIDQSGSKKSAIHRMDGRLKLLGLGCFICATAVLRSLPALAAAFAAAWCWVLLARLPLGPVLRRTGMAALFLGSFFFILPFSHPLGANAGLKQAAAIVLKDGAAASEGEIRAFAGERLILNPLDRIIGRHSG